MRRYFILAMMLASLLMMAGCQANETKTGQSASAAPEKATEQGSSAVSETETGNTDALQETAEISAETAGQAGQAGTEASSQPEAGNAGGDNANSGQTGSGYDPNASVRSELITLYEKTRRRSQEIRTALSEGYMDQQTMNQTAAEEYDNWDVLLNQIWAYLKDTLDKDEMEALTERQKNWIIRKEKAVEEAGREAEGGSMQPLLEDGEAAAWTRDKVEELMKAYVMEQQ